MPTVEYDLCREIPYTPNTHDVAISSSHGKICFGGLDGFLLEKVGFPPSGIATAKILTLKPRPKSGAGVKSQGQSASQFIGYRSFFINDFIESVRWNPGRLQGYQHQGPTEP